MTPVTPRNREEWATVTQDGNPSDASYALLGLLALRSWTGYELTQQIRRSLRLAVPASEATLYRDQARLVERGWASCTEEPSGRRSRKRYAITPAGRAALEAWLSSPPAPPSFTVDVVARAWLADQGDPHDLVATLAATAEQARASIDVIVEQSRGYLTPETTDFPARAHVNAAAAHLLVELLGALEAACHDLSPEVARWSDMTGDDLRSAATARFARIVASHENPPN
jgi:DNA-binding PadR family transcriptional regulator